MIPSFKESKLLVGSSSNNIGLSCKKALAIPILCFSSTRQGVSEFSDFGVVAIWQGHDHVMDRGFLSGFYDFFSCCAWFSDRYVIGDGVVEEFGFLSYVGLCVS